MDVAVIPRYTRLGKGRRTLENEAARRTAWPIVLKRAGYRCESCGSRDNVVWAHAFGRPATGLRLGPWANTAALTLALCDPGCHDRFDSHQDVALEDLLRWRAVTRLAVEYQRDVAKLAAALNLTDPLNQADPADVVRALVRQLEEDGLTPAA